MQPKDTIMYCHGSLNQEIQAIGGRYILTDEKKLPFKDRSIFYLTGHAVFDSTCCGAGGCVYAVVYGAIDTWKEEREDGKGPVTRTTPIQDEKLQQEIRRSIMAAEPFIQQVVFLSA